jgi:hypothetical protein
MAKPRGDYGSSTDAMVTKIRRLERTPRDPTGFLFTQPDSRRRRRTSRRDTGCTWVASGAVVCRDLQRADLQDRAMVDAGAEVHGKRAIRRIENSHRDVSIETLDCRI